MRVARPADAVLRAALSARHFFSLQSVLVTVSTFRRLIVLPVGLMVVLAGVVTGAPAAGAQVQVWAGAHLAVDTTTTRPTTTYDAVFSNSSPALAADGASSTGRSAAEGIAPSRTADRPALVFVAAEEGGAVLNFGSKAAARQGLEGDAGTAANRFFRDATAKSQDFQAQELSGGGYRLQFFSPANNPGYGKLYVQEIDSTGNVIREYKTTMGPDGPGETKWVHGG